MYLAVGFTVLFYLGWDYTLAVSFPGLCRSKTCLFVGRVFLVIRGGHSCWAAVERPCDCLFRPASTIIAGHYSLTQGIVTVSTNTSTSVLCLCAEAHALVDWGLQPVLAQMGAFGKRYQMSEHDQMLVLKHRIHFDVKLVQLDVKLAQLDVKLVQLDVKMDSVFRVHNFDTFGQIRARQPLPMSCTPEALTQTVSSASQ